MVVSDVEEKWKEALFEEDCDKVMKLLNKEKELVDIAWTSGNSSMVKEPDLCEGRTALHVGARRGCVALLRQAIAYLRLRPSKGAGNGTPEDGKGKKTAVDDEKKREEMKLLVKKDFQLGYKQKGDAQSSRLSDLLEKQDGKYKLDAIAIAALNGNLDVLDVLLDACLLQDCKKLARRYGIEGPRTRVEDRKSTEKDKRREIIKKTKEVIHKYEHDDPDLWKVCKSGYENHKDFNFLPIEEYLLHFLCVDLKKIFEGIKRPRRPYEKLLQKRVLRYMIREDRYSDSLWDFHMKLQDGRGRPPLHVAVDEGTLDVIFREIVDDKRIANRIRRGRRGMLYYSELRTTNEDDGRGTLSCGRQTWMMEGHPVLQTTNEDDMSESLMAGHDAEQGTTNEDDDRQKLYRQKFFEEPFKMIIEMIDPPDGRGRTVLHRIITLGKEEAVQAYNDMWSKAMGEHKTLMSDFGETGYINCLAEYCAQNYGAVRKLFGEAPRSLADTVKSRSGISINEDLLSIKNGFGADFELRKGEKDPPPEYYVSSYRGFRANPLGSAIVHQKFHILRQIMLGSIRHSKKVPGSSIRHCKKMPGSIKFSQKIPGSIKDSICQGNKDIFEDSVDKLMCENFPFWVEKAVDGYNNFQTEPILFNSLQLAALGLEAIGEKSMVETILEFIKKESRESEPSKGDIEIDGLFYKDCSKNPWPALQLAAGRAKYEMVKSLRKHGYCDPFMADCCGNTPLHHATNRSVIEFYFHLLDYVDCEQIFQTRDCRKSYLDEQQARRTFQNDGSEPPYIVNREGCINFLIRCGCDIFKRNGQDELPDTTRGMHSHFVQWWHDKQKAEFEDLQKTFNTIIGAISVVATLIATTSFDGPHDTPFGYDPDNLNLGIMAVKVFIFCDTICFYLGITVAICCFTLVIPKPHQPMMDELKHSRKMARLLLGLLLPSIICFLLAFASSSIAVIYVNPSSWNHEGLTLGLTFIGAMFCVLSIRYFLDKFKSFLELDI